jgi:DNA-binding LytR/AlgR family response regulator
LNRPHAITAVVAEDEPILRADLLGRLGALWPELRVVGAAADGLEALTLFELHRPDILFLDIAMPRMDGLELAQRVSGRCHVVFITAYDAHALAAFEHGAVDYVLKPYQNERLAIALGRLKSRLALEPVRMEALIRELSLDARPKDYLRWIKASRGSEIDLITVGDVLFFQADSKYTCVVTETREAVIRRSIKELAAELDPQLFWQIHRSTIVNVEAIQSVSRTLGGVTVKLRSRPQRMKVSQPYQHLFRHM